MPRDAREVFKAAGYYASIGKWHLGTEEYCRPRRVST